MSVIEYQCPNCGGAIVFDSDAQMMKCPYCDAEFDVAALREMDEALSRSVEDAAQWDVSSGEWHPREQDGLGVFVCQSCGGEIVADENRGATFCPYCGGPVVLTSRFSGTLRPDLVIPFQLNKDEAKTALKKHYGGKRLLPKVFKDENHIDELTGMYVPFWLYSAEAEADIHYRATRTRIWSDHKRRYSEISYFDVYRHGDIAFDLVPEDGASKVDDTMMEAIEPFDWRGAVDFQTAYLSGYIADKYDEDAVSCEDRANRRIKNSTEEAFQESIHGFQSVTKQHSNIALHNASVRYALLPVWFLNTSWNGKRYYFAMNGQTGKLAGDLPLDRGLFWKWFLGIFVILALLLNLIAIPIAVFGAEPEQGAYVQNAATAAVEQDVYASVASAEEDTAAESIPRNLPRFVDAANLLTEQEETELNAKLDRISEQWSCDVVIVDVYALESSVYDTDYDTKYFDWTDVQDYADAFFWFNGYGFGDERSGILLLLSMEYRDYAVSTHGFGIKAFTDAGLDYILEDVLAYLADDNYSAAYDLFADYANQFLEQARNDTPYDIGGMPMSPAMKVMPFILLTLLALLVAFVVVFSWKRKLKSVKPAPFAREYFRPGSMVVTNGYERFLYRTVVVTVIKSSSGSGWGGGGSSVHTSSFGGSFGGKSGKF